MVVVIPEVPPVVADSNLSATVVVGSSLSATDLGDVVVGVLAVEGSATGKGRIRLVVQ